jgi:glycosyltransferase involved in cell wall biosynthesis
MASGAQIVASDLPSFVDLLGARQNEQRLGEVFTVGDHRSLAEAVLQVLDHPDPMRAARAQQVARTYDWLNVGSTVLAIYRAALSAAPARRTGTGVG